MHTYLVGETESQVQAVRREGRSYLRAAPDREVTNNLAQVPRCGGEAAKMIPALVRRDITSVSNAERSRLLNAILAIHERYYSDGVSWWFKQDHVHQATHVHDEPSFLPWHRELTNRFEALLQEIDPGVALHYWDWTTDPRTSGTIFTPAFMGSSEGEVGPPFQHFYNGGQDAGSRGQTRNPADPPRILQRAVPAWGPKDSPNPDYRVVDDWQTITTGDGNPQEAQFGAFRVFLKAIHGRAHCWIGGNIGDAHSSFEDPFVFLLHSNVDRLWAGWQLRRLGDQRLSSWRLDPSRIYGDEGNHREMIRAFEPWAGQRDADRNIVPWKEPENQQERKTATHPTIVNPPLYDNYGHDELCMSWSALRLRRDLPDGDVIGAIIEQDAVEEGRIELALETGPGVTWWKMIQVPNADGVSSIWTEASRRSDALQIAAHQLRDGQELIFHKAKSFGERRIVYRLNRSGWLPPRSRVTFRWLQD
jgi:hypothetical protein